MKIKTLIQTAKKYGIRSFLTKSFIMFASIFLVIFLVISVLLSLQYRQNLIASMDNVIMQTTKDSRLLFDSFFSDSEKCKEKIITSADIQLFLYPFAFDNPIITGATNELYNIIQECVKNSKIISSVYLYSKTNDYILAYGQNCTSEDLMHFSDKELILSADMSKTAIYYKHSNNDDQTSAYMSLCIPFWQLSESPGMLFFNINFNNLYNQLSEVNPYMNNYYLIQDNTCILSSKPESTGKSAESRLLDILSKCNDGYYSSAVNKQEQYTSAIFSSENNYTLILENTNNNLRQSIISANRTVTIIIIVMIIISLLISCVLTLYFYRYIAILVIAFETPNSISDSNIMKLNSYNEITFLLNTVIQNSTTANVNAEFQSRLNALEKLHAITLQSQITPHFISNTLNTVNSAIMREFKRETPSQIMIANLSQLLKYTFKTTENIVPLKTELHYLKIYVEIEKIKKNNSFNIKYNIAENTLENPVLKLSLQPFLENAFFYAVKPGGTIIVSSYYENDVLNVDIEDDGQGFDDETIEIINKSLKSPNSSFELPKKHIGIINSHQRIRLIFGSDYGCCLSSDEHGTKATLKFPKTDIK